MIDSISFLGKKQELEFRKRKFSGKAAGKIYQYSDTVDSLIRTRAIILAMVLLALYPVVVYYFATGEFQGNFMMSRLIYSLFFLVAGLIFNKLRLLSVLIAAVPAALIIIENLFFLQPFSFYRTGFAIAIFGLILSGLFYNYKVIKLEKELRNILLENQLITPDE